MRALPIFLAFALTPFSQAQQPPPATFDIHTAAQQIVALVIAQNVVDQEAKTPTTGKPIATTGKWSVTQSSDESCGAASACVHAVYTIPDANLICQWTLAIAQPGSTPVIVDEDANAAHYFLRKPPPDQVKSLILTRVNPVYPPIAEAAHVSGVVNLTLIIGGDGKPFFVDVDSGPAMLVGSAKDAARRWQFAAIKARGAPVRWITHLVFDFTNSGVSKVTVAP